jgi:hypothetical protein
MSNPLCCSTGHGGYELADYIVKTLPEMIRDSLETLIGYNHSQDESTNDEYGDIKDEAFIDRVSSILQDSIIAADDRIRDDFLSLFVSPDFTTPGSTKNRLNIDEVVKRIESMSEEEVKQIINDHDGPSGGKNHAVVTALIGLMDPKRENLWIANLGDCQASK